MGAANKAGAENPVRGRKTKAKGFELTGWTEMNRGGIGFPSCAE